MKTAGEASVDEPRYLSGEYGPRFVGYGPEPVQPRSISPWLYGLAIGLGSLIIMLLTGAL